MRINHRNPAFDRSKNDAFIDDWNPGLSSATGYEPRSDDSLDIILSPPTDPALLEDTVAPVSKEQIDRDLRFSVDRRVMETPDTANMSLDGDRTALREPVSGKVEFPKLGEAIGGFRLIFELGRGAFARVYLAQEVGLGSRHVALKVSRAEGEEPQILARLQHTHIVPIHSLYDDPRTGLRLICMPYFGGANLQQVLEAAGQHRGVQSQGKSLVNALDLIGQPVIASVPAKTKWAAGSVTPPPLSLNGPSTMAASTSDNRSLLGRIPWWNRARGSQADTVLSPDSPEVQSQPARHFMSESSYVRASVWIMARLAEGLEHAHSRLLLHRDLKPSNILIAADGTPMLLDFNLAAETEIDTTENGEKARLGGTLPYMSPEHLDAFNPVGATSASEVGVRSDIYALGLILFEMVAGRHPFPPPPDGMKLLDVVTLMTEQRRQGAPSLRGANPEAPWSLDAIVTKSLDPDPAGRYRTAGEFAEELRRFLDDQPLKYTREPSFRETLGKWARRNPRASSASTILPLASCLVLVIGSFAVTQSVHLKEVAARLYLRKFHEVFQESQFLLNTTSGGDLTGHLELGVKKARAAIDRFGITRAGDWEKSYWVSPLAAEERTGLRRDLAELIVLEARATVALAEKEGTEGDRWRALEWAVAWLDRAENLDSAPSAAIYVDRARYHRALGQADLAQRDKERAEKTPSSTCRDEYLLGTADLAIGRYDRAEARLNHAVSLDSNRFWAWFALGLCHHDQGRFNDAVTDFSVCTVLMPQFAWPFANRGQALARSGRLAEARDAFSKALELSPDFVDALVGRGLVYLEMGQAAEAEADLRRAKSLGKIDPGAEAGLAEAMAKAGRQAEALEIYSRLIATHPSDARLLAARGMIQIATNPRAATADLQAAAQIDPKLAMPYFGLATINYRTDLSRALESIDQALERDPRLLDAIQLRSLIRARLGRVDALDDVESVLQKPTDHRLYNAACAVAVLAKHHPEGAYEGQALHLLKRALDAGFPRGVARADPDFAVLANRDDYRTVVQEQP